MQPITKYTANDYASIWENTHVPVLRDSSGSHGGVNFLVPDIDGSKRIGFYSPEFTGMTDANNAFVIYSKDIGEGYGLPKLEFTVDANKDITSFTNYSSGYYITAKSPQMHDQHLVKFVSDSFFQNALQAYNNEDWNNWLGGNRNYGGYDLVWYYDSANSSNVLSVDICAIIESSFDYYMDSSPLYKEINIYAVGMPTKGQLPLNKFFYDNILSFGDDAIIERNRHSNTTIDSDVYYKTLRAKYYITGTASNPFVAVGMPVFTAPMVPGTHYVKVQGLYMCFSNLV